MSTNQLHIVGTGLFYLVIFLSGFWLNRSGKPYNGIIFSSHKLVALTGVVLFIITLVRANGVGTLNAVELTTGIVTGLFFLSLFVTGGLLSIDKPMPAIVLRLHQVMPYLAVLSTAVTLYLLLSRKQ